jgi:hypothetical protein
MTTTEVSPEQRAGQIEGFIKAIVGRNGITPEGVEFTMGLLLDAFRHGERQTLEDALSKLSGAEHILDDMKAHAGALKMLLKKLLEKFDAFRAAFEFEGLSPLQQHIFDLLPAFTAGNGLTAVAVAEETGLAPAQVWRELRAMFNMRTVVVDDLSAQDPQWYRRLTSL